jgi:TetR/AcrR family transcriptional repressor of nem operon
MIGGLAMARAVAKSRPDLSDEIMAAVRLVLGEVGGEGGEPRN